MTKPLEQGLAESAKRRREIVGRFGFVPTSVLRLRRGALSRRVYQFQAEHPERRGGTLAYAREMGLGSTPEARANTEERERRGLRQARYARNPSKDRRAVSIMPAELVQFFVRFYSKPGAVYVDPFVGQGVRMQVAKIEGLDYLGTDVSKEFLAFVEKVRERIDDGTTRIEIHDQDARDLSAIEDEAGDFCFTSPPYWDIEWYGAEVAQLGRGKDYATFLGALGAVVSRLYSKLRPGAVAAWNVNDFRRDGRFYAYHVDVWNLFVERGFEPLDVWIVEGNLGGLSRAFSSKNVPLQIATRVHEYVLVFRRT